MTFFAGIIFFYTIKSAKNGGQLRAPLWRALSVYVLLFIALILSIDRGESFLGCYPAITHSADLLFKDITGQAIFNGMKNLKIFPPEIFRVLRLSRVDW